MKSSKGAFGSSVLLLSLCFILAAALPPASHSNLARSTPIPPSDDPFYSPPAGYEGSAPGTILRSRAVPNPLSLLNILPVNIKGAYQLLYRTTDTQGHPQATVTTVIVPYNADPTKLLSYQTAEDAAWINCAPSYAIQQGTNIFNGVTSSVELVLVIASLNEGWIVNIPDYEGPQAAFTSGLQAGRATLDSVRAALASSSITGVSPLATYQMWGYSGGSLASEWAAELQPTYAPELHFAGVALGGLIPNITSVALTINKGPFAGLLPTGILGLVAAYPTNLTGYLNEYLVPSKAAAFKKPLKQCIAADAIEFIFQDIFSYSTIGLGVLNLPGIQVGLNETGVMGLHGTPQMPLFVYKGVFDEVSVVADTDNLVQKLCSKGAQIQYVRELAAEHGVDAVTGAAEAFLFLKDRFKGIPATSGCRTSTVLSAALNPAAIEVFGSTIADALSAILGKMVGPYAGGRLV